MGDDLQLDIQVSMVLCRLRLDEQTNLRKEKNLFETRVTEYQTGGALSWY
ncbi:MAG: hypothetical protein KGI47_00690 [Betaproteobacteria bacterium]|nr:hypothetical protein [Betaproteobacteria bacterium]MDE2621667.1 hypothetical protein [Betaproteobacteria bacterium]